MPGNRDNISVDFLKVISILSKRLREHNVKYMLVGGVALGLHGIVRGTKDVDFLILEADREKVSEIMTSEGYERIDSGKGFLQFRHLLKVFGQVDYLLVQSHLGIDMLSHAISTDVDENLIDLPVARLEDIVILKLLVLKGGKERGIDREDLRRLIAMHGPSLDWSYIEDCAKILGMEAVLKDVRS